MAEVSEGELFRVETVDWTGGQIGDNDSAEDIKHVDLSQVTLQLAQTSPVGAAKGPWLPTWKGLAACFHGCQAAFSGLACPLDDTCPAACHRLVAACMMWHTARLSYLCVLQVHYLSGPIRVVDADGQPAQPGTAVVSSCHVVYVRG